MSSQTPEHVNWADGNGVPSLPPTSPAEDAMAQCQRAFEEELPRIIPVRQRRDEQSQLALRLEAVLAGGARSLGCHAAALYLLDEATTQLKLRACWGLPRRKLLEPARPLRGALGDLEALLGHAVAIEDTSLLPHWEVPEPCRAALCVPVASPTDPLGTLWMFCNEARNFDDQQTNLAEIVAGRIAADLQRDVLLGERSRIRAQDRQWLAARRWQLARQPSLQPSGEEWQVLGLTADSHRPVGAFFDWWVAPDSCLAFVAGSCGGEPTCAALQAAELRGIMYGLALSNPDVPQTIERAADAFRQASAFDDEASLAYARVDPRTRQVECAALGQAVALHVRPEGTRSILHDSPPLSLSQDVRPPTQHFIVREGESLLLATWDPLATVDLAMREQLANIAGQHAGHSAEELLAATSERLEVAGGLPAWSLLVLR